MIFMPCIILLSLYTYTLKIQEGSYVLLFHTPRKKWLAKVTLEKKLHTHLGIIDISSVIGMEYGSAVRTTEGKLIFLIEPTIHDFIMKSERRTQIVYPKDLGYINPEFMEIARRNLEKADMSSFVTMNQHDPHQGVDVRDADVAIVDLGDPWTVLDQVHDALKGSGAFVAICPTMNQIEKTAAELKKSGYADIDCVELMIRNMEAREGMTRPSMRMIGHTTYLVFARKVQKQQQQAEVAEEEGEAEEGEEAAE